MQWLVDHSWTLWLIAAVLLAVCELATVDLMFLMAAVGAIVGGIVAGTAGGLILPVIAFALATLVLFAVLRPWLLKRWGGAMRFEVSRYIGHETTAASEIALDHPGKVMIEGVPWTARPWEPADVIEPGTNIVVVATKPPSCTTRFNAR